MKKVKHGVLGLGWFGEKHCEALAAIPNVELHAICTRNPERLAEVAKKFGVTNTFTDYQAMLADPDLESVSITTMWDQHAAPAVAALQAGKHVFLEKPMASTIADCNAIVDASNSAKGFLMVGHICRFNPRYALARDRIKAGELGRIVSMYARRNIPAARSRGVLEKIGPLLGDGIHDTDLMLWMSGAKVATVYAQTLSVRNLKNPDIGWAMYRFDSGAIGVIENVWFLPAGTPFRIHEQLEIIGTDGAVYVQGSDMNLTVQTRQGVDCPDTLYWPEIHGAIGGALRAEMSYFADCVARGEAPTVVTPAEARAAVAVLAAAERSAQTGKVVRL
jgi:UDP-N-acetylglucosamine 3-dehydrogenase